MVNNYLITILFFISYKDNESRVELSTNEQLRPGFLLQGGHFRPHQSRKPEEE